MKEIKNSKNKLLCTIDEDTGTLQNRHKKQVITTFLPIGSTTEIVRDDIRTVITRTSQRNYKIENYEITA